jgi:tetratricopeptide (TPR) repeat protein
MTDIDPFYEYINLAEKIFDHNAKLTALATTLAELPPINRDLVEKLAEESEKESLNRPRMSWAICYVAERASRLQKLDLFTRSLAAWYLGRAANYWVQPQKMQRAIARARRGFKKLNKQGWLAACDWQENENPWTSSNLVNSEITLKKCIEIFRKNNRDHYVPQCQLTLSLVLALENKIDEALVNISECEKWFTEKEDDLNLARCWRNKATVYRRLSNFSDAIFWSNKSEVIFSEKNSLKDLAMNWNVIGLIKLFSLNDIKKITPWFLKAKKIFRKLEPDLLILVSQRKPF